MFSSSKYPEHPHKNDSIETLKLKAQKSPSTEATGRLQPNYFNSFLQILQILMLSRTPLPSISFVALSV